MKRDKATEFGENQSNRLIIAFISIGVFCFAFGVICSRIFFSPRVIENTIATPPVRLGAQGLINPLLFTKSGTEKSSQLQHLEDELQKQINQDEQEGDAGDISIYFQDLNSGRWTGVNETDLYSPASLLKVPIELAYFKAAETSSAILGDQLAYDGSYDENSAEDIKPVKQIEKGSTYSVSDLLRYMIEYSDNNATILLAQHIGMDAVTNVFSDLTIPYSSSTTLNLLNPKQYSIFYRVLYSATYLDRNSSEEALELLSNSDFPQGIEAGLPPDAVVAQKFGERFVANETEPNKELHDCGIVYHPANPYLICIMTKGTDFTKLEGVFPDVSKIAWDAAGDNYQ